MVLHPPSKKGGLFRSSSCQVNCGGGVLHAARRWMDGYATYDDGDDGVGLERDGGGYGKTEASPRLKPLKEREKTKPILVVGSTGRVGRKVVEKLLSKNIPVRAFARDYEKAVSVFGDDYARGRGSPLDITIGDINNPDELERAVRGCDSVISVSHTVRTSKLLDLLLPWRLFRHDVSGWCGSDKSHPYHTNYMGQLRLIRLAEKHELKKIVRVTDLYVGLPASGFVSVLSNAARSMTFRYHALLEVALRNSTVPHVVLRPGDLSDEERDTETTSLQIEPSGTLPSPSLIGRSDLASLAIEACQSTDPQNYTLAVRWVGENMYPQPQGKYTDGCATAKECFQKLSLDHCEKSEEEEEERNSSLQRERIKPYAAHVGLTVYPTMILFGRFLFLLARKLGTMIADKCMV
eukprot:CAMPEP_0195525474 /NCGR_PEP_ID=MMETSP0794_2-20130614/25964_1 /TAXON_ID=515487 /ORGANISM="Stephanopyxis turris, Strain CCMP 815" /LENGTH=406 /DNA_ID=CAMNT_0040655953 /DNA_START=82 /DNA_END=1302 /DNA_ORIENTATION=-